MLINLLSTTLKSKEYRYISILS